MRVARERAEIRKQREQQEAAQAQSTAKDKPKVEETTAKTPPPENTTTAKNTTQKPSTKSSGPASRTVQPDPPPKIALAANSDQPDPVTNADVEKESASDAEAALSGRDQLMTFGRLGKQVAFVGASQSIGVYDVQSKRLTRQIYNPQLTPLSMAIGEEGEQLIVGGTQGGFKVFSLESVDGHDKFQQLRKLRLDAAPPPKAHNLPVSAVAVSDRAGLAATGDTGGELKLWSSEIGPALKLTSDSGGCSHLLSYRDDQILFAAAGNKIVFWQLGSQRSASREFAEAVFDQPLTSMVIGPEGKGLAVGDASGRVTLWTADQDDLKKVTFPAHESPVAGLGFADNGDTLVTVGRTGELARWKLPLEQQQTFEVVDSPEFIVSSSDGRTVGFPSRGKNLDIYSLENGSAVRRHTLNTGQLTAAEISSDGAFVALANDTGRILFQDQRRSTVAYAQLADDGITQLARSPDQSGVFAFTTTSGDVGVATFPHTRSAPEAVTGNVAVMNRSGSVLITANHSDLRALGTKDGQFTNSSRINDGRVTALAIDENLALIGTSVGSIWSWAYTLPDSVPEILTEADDESEVLAVGKTNSGQVWSCNANGQTRTTQFVKKQRFERGSINLPITDASAYRDGSVAILDENRRLRIATTIEGPFVEADDQPWRQLFGRENWIGTIGEAGQFLEVRSGADNPQVKVDVPAGTTISSADVAGQTLSVLLSDQSVVGIGLPESTATQHQLGEGPLEQSLISSDGQTIVSRDPEGQVLAASVTGKARILNDLRQTTPLAVSSDGRLLAIEKGGRASCYEISRDSQQLVMEFTDEISDPSAASFSADSRVIVFSLQSGGIVSVPTTAGGTLRKIAQLNQPAGSITLDEVNDRIVCQHPDGGLTVIEGKDGNVHYQSGTTSFVAVSVGGGKTFAATSEGQVYQLTADNSELSLLTQGIDPIEGLSATPNGQNVAFLTSTGLMGSIDVDTGVMVTMPASDETGRLLAMKATDEQSTTIREDGKVRSLTFPRIKTIAPKSSGIQKLSVAANGSWILGVRSNGSLIRWSAIAGKFSAPMQASSRGKATDVVSLATSSGFAVLSSPQMVSIYQAGQDSFVASLKLPDDAIRLLNATDGGIVVIDTQEGALVANLRTGSIEPIPAEWGFTDDGSHVLATSGEGQSGWAALHSDGSFVKSSRLSPSQSANDFTLETPPNGATIRAGLLVSADPSGVQIRRADGSVVGNLQVSDEEVVCFAADDSVSRIAACDQNGRLAIMHTDSSKMTRLQLPTKHVRSIAWSDDGEHVAATDGKRIIAVNGISGKVESQLIADTKIGQLVSWNQGQLWYFDESSRLRHIVLPTLRWKQNIGSRPSGLTWSESGQELVALTERGTLAKYDALGHEQARVSVGKPNCRSLRAVPNSGSYAFLAGNEVHLWDSKGQLSDLSMSSAIGLRSLCCSGDGRYFFASNDLGRIVFWDLAAAEAGMGIVPADIRCDSLTIMDGDRILATSKQEPKVVVVPTSLRTEIQERFPGPIESVQVSRNGAFVGGVDGTSKVVLLPLVGGAEPRELDSDGLELKKISIAPGGDRVAALGQAAFGGGSSLVVWETVDLNQLAQSDLSGQAEMLCHSHDGNLIAVGFADGHCEVYDASSAKMLESIPATEGLETVAFAQDNKKLLLAHGDGLVSVQPLLALGQTQASKSAIVSASFHGEGKYLLCASQVGDLTLWNCDSFKAPQAAFAGAEAAIGQSKVSSDGRYVLAVYEDTENSTYIWDLDDAKSGTSQIEPKLIIRSEVASSSAAFTSDSRFLLVGGSDGTIRAWSLADNREIARFEGHQGPVMDIAPVADVGHFVSGGTDHAIRSWRFPSSLPPPGADIPQGALADATEVQDLEKPKDIEQMASEDPYDAARQALIAGAETRDVLDLLAGNEQAKSDAKKSLARVVALEKGVAASAAELSQRRRQLAETQRRLAPSENAQTLSNFAEGFSNLTFVADSNFKFGLDREYRPARLMFADRFLYAARTSAKKRARSRAADDESEEVDEGDNGALLSWDYRYSRLQAHAWSIEDLEVQQLFPLPNSAGVFTVPQVILFSQDGSSRELADIASWAASNQPPPQRQFLAVGTAGSRREENDILKVFDVADLSRDSVAPTSQYRTFEGVVTAMAFANTSPYIAFCVRERAVHRLFIADAETLQLTKLEEYNHDEPWIESDTDGGTSRGARRIDLTRSKAAPGITSLAFSPEDGLLVAQGEYNKGLHKFSRWKLSWTESGEFEAFSKSSKELENEDGPFFLTSGSKSIWFIEDRSRRAPPPTTAQQIKSRDAGVLRVLVRVRDGFAVVNLNSQREEHKIKFLKTHHGIPEYTISDDGRWLIMGDDNGVAYIWDTLEGTRFCVTIDAATEKRIQEARGGRLQDIPERPAHTGPIVGVALSEPDPGRDYPAFAATIGEENKVKVWELYPLLDPESGLRSTNVARSVVRTVNTTKNKTARGRR